MRILVDKETGEEFKVQSDSSEYLVVAPVPKKTKVIDWSKVAYCVPVKNITGTVLYRMRGGRGRGDSLKTGVKVAWTGGECPLPEGVLIKYGTRSLDLDYHTIAHPERLLWGHPSDIIWFEVVGLEKGYCYE